MLFSHTVYNVSLGFIDTPTLCASVHIQCKACTCAAVMCFKIVALPLGIRHTRHRQKKNCMMLTHMMYNVSLGVVDISTPCAGVCENILLHMLVVRNL